MSDTKWPGTPAEWDAERDRRAEAMRAANAQVGLSYTDLATTTMPPRPVEPPSVVMASGWTVTWTGNHFRVGSTQYFKMAHDAAWRANASEAEHDAIRALRDGPTARYEVCGYEHWRGNKYVQTFHVSDTMTAESCKKSVQFEIIQTTGGGTAHAIYKRVGGA